MLSRRAVCFMVAVAACASACESRDEPPDCLDQRQEARKLALRGDLERAQQLLEQVKARCGPNSQSDVQHVTRLIAEKTAARQRQAELDARRRVELEQFPSRSFVEWATARGGYIDGKLSNPVCAERGAPDFGFCESARPEAPSMRVRYWQAEPEAYRYSLTTPLAPSCQDLGEYRQVRAWRRDGGDFELCELTDRRLRHLSALIAHTGATYEMHLFSQKYLGVDPAFERRLRIIPDARGAAQPSER